MVPRFNIRYSTIGRFSVIRKASLFMERARLWHNNTLHNWVLMLKYKKLWNNELKLKSVFNWGGTTLKIIKIMLALIVVAISMYGLMTKDFSYGPISSLLLGFLFAIMGIEEYKMKGKNGWGMLLIIGSLLIIVMALFSF